SCISSLNFSSPMVKDQPSVGVRKFELKLYSVKSLTMSPASGRTSSTSSFSGMLAVKSGIVSNGRALADLGVGEQLRIQRHEIVDTVLQRRRKLRQRAATGRRVPADLLAGRESLRRFRLHVDDCELQFRAVLQRVPEHDVVG